MKVQLGLPTVAPIAPEDKSVAWLDAAEVDGGMSKFDLDYIGHSRSVEVRTIFFENRRKNRLWKAPPWSIDSAAEGSGRPSWLFSHKRREGAAETSTETDEMQTKRWS